MANRLYLVALAVSVTCPAAWAAGPAQAGVWESGGPDGGTVQALAIDPMTPSTLYAAARGAGILKSTDSGSTWAATNTGLFGLCVVALAIQPTTPSTLYAGMYDGD